MVAPRKYDRDKLVQDICARLADGEPLTVICRSLGIPKRTVDEWRGIDPLIAAQFDDARDHGYDAIAKHAREVASGNHRKGKDSSTNVQRDKLIVETDLKLLAKWDPRRYGDKQQVSLEGGERPIVLQQLTREELRATLQAAIPKLTG
ncbi:terminase small subunit-like protein [Rhodanobacter hydrolyticus]|uniref:Terminase n=1 Tax=Rhodanobacter hydrolyticus TaxID=2250595 RepID=A0ABW8J5S9_9GAMM